MATAANAAVIDRLLRHNAYATRVLLERCRDLTAAQFIRAFNIGPGSLHDTLLHVVGAMLRWSDRIDQRPLRDSVEAADRTWTPNEIIVLLAEAADDLDRVVRRVIEQDQLDEPMAFALRDERFVFTRGTAIVHVATHGVHHRAQALNMLRRLGVEDLPDLDAIEWELADAPPPGAPSPAVPETDRGR